MEPYRLEYPTYLTEGHGSKIADFSCNLTEPKTQTIPTPMTFLETTKLLVDRCSILNSYVQVLNWRAPADIMTRSTFHVRVEEYGAFQALSIVNDMVCGTKCFKFSTKDGTPDNGANVLAMTSLHQLDEYYYNAALHVYEKAQKQLEEFRQNLSKALKSKIPQ
jgi:hypothetical protein